MGFFQSILKALGIRRHSEIKVVAYGLDAFHPLQARDTYCDVPARLGSPVLVHVSLGSFRLHQVAMKIEYGMIVIWSEVPRSCFGDNNSILRIIIPDHINSRKLMLYTDEEQKHLVFTHDT